jgi:site-specific DNA-methyltransferase (adenine-specific)
MSYTILQGDNRETLKTIPDNSIDAIVTDPPYGIDFLGKAWDANTGALTTYQECLRVLKPGGHILAFSAARTYHHLAITLEQAGFEIRDQIMWIYSSGFPKSQDIGKSIERTEKKRADNALGIKRSNIESGPKTNCPKCNLTLNGENQYKCKEQQCDLRDALAPALNEWAGWGTALKPAHEPIALARKPMKGSIAKNCQQWGTGALNIDATRIPYVDDKDKQSAKFAQNPNMLPYDPEKQIDYSVEGGVENRVMFIPDDKGRFPSNVIGDIPLYQKYFYCPKVSRKERHIGFDTSVIPTNPNGILDNKDENGNQVLAIDSKRLGTELGNNHPTVKPIELMKYLIKLITPPGGTVLDPFNGSGSTGCAAVELGFDYIGCELDPAYVEISLKRIEAWTKVEDPNDKLLATGLFE